jgi:predicted methyltransferase
MDLRKGINLVSEVINNRPKALREFDQIYMKAADMLIQTEHIGEVFNDKEIVFIGDGDSIGLCLSYLFNEEIIEKGPKHVHILDFDERIVLSVQNFAEKFKITEKISSELYNVAHPLPTTCWQKFDGFYTNPPFGASNGGKSITGFVKRGIECLRKDGLASIVIADYPKLQWTQELLYKTEKYLIDKSFVISEIIPEFHHYHLDDTPDLTSCSLIARLSVFEEKGYCSTCLPQDYVEDFYGHDLPLVYKYVKDKTNGGKLASKDHELLKLE